jgi:hypothetical protein
MSRLSFTIIIQSHSKEAQSFNRIAYQNRYLLDEVTLSVVAKYCDWRPVNSDVSPKVGGVSWSLQLSAFTRIIVISLSSF